MVVLLDSVQKTFESIHKSQLNVSEITRALTATRYSFAMPRFALPMADMTSTFDSLGKVYDLSHMHAFLESHRSTFEAASRLQTSVLGDNRGLWGINNQASALSTTIEQLSKARVDAGQVASFSSALEGMRSTVAQIAASAQSLNEIIRAACTTTIPQFPVGGLFVHLPDLTTLAPRFEKAQRARAALEEGGFSFTGHLWTWSSLLSFADASTRVTPAAVTSRVLRYTRSAAFEKALKKTIEGSRVLRRRWRIVESALAAHTRRDYYLAIPALLAQLEGMLGDALILKGSVRVDGHTLVERLQDGRDKLNKRGIPVSIRGLDRLVRVSPFLQHDALELAAHIILNSVAKDRHPILHGRSTQYGKPQFSGQLVLMIYAFAVEIAAFENGRVKW